MFSEGKIRNTQYAVEKFIEKLEQALTLPNFDWRAAQERMGIGGRVYGRPSHLPGEGRRGAVMMLFYPKDSVPTVAYTLRPKSLRDHSGQVSFPGGKIDGDETPREAALREIDEELAVKSEDVQIIGRLSKLYIPPSDFHVDPFVGWCDVRPNFRPNPSEVAQLIEAPLPLLLDPATTQRERREFRGREFDVPYFAVGGQKIWGATALMTGEFLVRWQTMEQTGILS